MLNNNNINTFTLKEGEYYIPLIQLLKVLNIASSGANAQQMVIEGCVKVNNITELRKRAKIREGDIVEALGNKILISQNNN
ncbi:MAG: RNA-binding S4 domain-containing protein [Bacteroidales bacterium]|jgi:ribosome-associated protein|nr:RNA-binding S4 domain-containing protein [Bacteroidales bacterium]